MNSNIVVDSIEKELLQRDFLIKKECEERNTINILDFETMNAIKITEKIKKN